jgi:phage tail tape-measure protein
MESGFVLKEPKIGTEFSDAVGTGATVGSAAGSVVPGVGTAIGGAVGAGVGFLTKVFGGNNESVEDKNKQKLQKELKKQGFGKFTKMSGWKGNEAKKEEAMRIILVAVNEYSSAASMISGWLEGGQVTPNTIMKTKTRYPQKGSYKVDVKQSKSGKKVDIQNIVSEAAKGFTNQKSGSQNGGVPAVAEQSPSPIKPIYLYAGGALVLVGVGMLALKN